MTKPLNDKQDTAPSSGPTTMATEDEAWLLSVLSTEDMDSMRRTENQRALERWNVYTSIDDLPFTVFEDVSVTKDVTRLARIEGAPIHVLNEAWASLQGQFSEAVGGETMALATSLSAEAESLDQQGDLVQLILDEVQGVMDTASTCGLPDAAAYAICLPLFQTLQDWDFDRDFSEESWRSDLEWVANAAKNMVMLRDTKLKELEDLKPKQAQESSGEMTRRNFDRALINISDYKKYHIQKDSITTAQFCLHYRDYLNHVEAEKNRQAKGQVQPAA